MQRIPRILRGLFKTLFGTGTRVHHRINVGKYLYDDDDDDEDGEGDDRDVSNNNNNVVTVKVITDG